MREIILKNDNRVDIRKFFLEYLKENQINEYYEKKIKGKVTSLYIFVYETSYRKALYGNKTPVNITVTNTVIGTIKEDKTEVSIVLGSDDKTEVRSSLLLYLKDRGFYAEL